MQQSIISELEEKSYQVNWKKSDFNIPSSQQTVSIENIVKFGIYANSKHCKKEEKKQQQKPKSSEDSLSIGKYLNSHQMKDSFMSLFGDSDQLINLSNGILAHQQFLQLLQQKLKQNDPYHKRQLKMAERQFYKKKVDQSSLGTYYTQYLKWKEVKPQKILDITQIQGYNFIDVSATDVILQKQLERQQWEYLKSEQNDRIRNKKAQMLKKTLRQIQQQYKAKMSELLKNKKYVEQKEQRQQQKKYKKLTMNKIQMPQIVTPQANTNNQNIQKYNHRKPKQQLQFISYTDLIRHPPKKKSCIIQASKNIDQKKIDNYSVNASINKSVTENESILSQQTRKSCANKQFWRLQIDKMIQMPHKAFLIFYSQNHNKLVELSSPSQLSILNRYRDQCLQREQNLQRLRQKIRRKGKQILPKLSKQKKQKLFKVLYEEQFQSQINKQSIT